MLCVVITSVCLMVSWFIHRGIKTSPVNGIGRGAGRGTLCDSNSIIVSFHQFNSIHLATQKAAPSLICAAVGSYITGHLLIANKSYERNLIPTIDLCHLSP